MDDWRPRDLLSSVHEVCRLHWRKRGQPDVRIEELETAGLAYLRISYTHGPWTKHELVGVFDGEPDEPALRRLRSLAGDDDTELVFRGGPPPEPIGELARNSRIWLRGFAEYQTELWDPKPYLRTQNATLAGDPEYPLALHVDKRWAPLGSPTPADQTALSAIKSWLATPGPAFVLVLGDFGTGKTFLLRTIAHELATGDVLAPVLITMRDLANGRTLDELLAQHMARCDEDPFHGSGFRYLLREGRIALLFDGFDELALRTSYERVPQHFATLREAAAGSAKVVITSRHQYFATDQSVRNALGDEVHRLPGSRIIRLFPLESGQCRELAARTFADADAADEFIDALRDVPNLLDLATNPRMLAFMVRWYREGILTRAALAQSAGRPMTAGALYELLLTGWLEHEATRLKPLSVRQRMDALTETAMRMWRTGRRSLGLDDLGEIAERISDLARLEMRPGEATQTIGSSTVLVRTKDNEFAFIHQSVMEWFVAHLARQAFAQGNPDEVLAHHELTIPMVDFICDLSGSEAVADWARDIAGREDSPGPLAKANASLVLQRKSVQTTAVNYAGQDLRGRDLSAQDLCDANLSGADLSGTVLPKAMRRADLSRAKLVGARLDQADLTDANLRRADLSHARLVGADLTGANLDEVVLERAVLIGAQLDRAALANANVFGAALFRTSLAQQIAQESPARTITSLPSGDLVATGHDDGTIRISNVTSGQILRVLTGHMNAVLGVVGFSHGRLLASASADGTVRVWDTSTCELVRTLKSRQGGLSAVAAGLESNWVAAGWKDGTVLVWQTTSDVPVHTLAAHVSRVTALAVSPEGDRLTTADVASIRQWDIESGDLLSTVATRGGGPIKQLMTDPYNDCVWVRSLARLSRLDATSELGVRSTAMAVGPASDWLAIAMADGSIQLYDNVSGQFRVVTRSTGWEIEALAMGPDGLWLASVDNYGRLHTWDTATGRPLCVIASGPASQPSIVVDPERGKWLISGNTAQSHVWDVNIGKVSDTLAGRILAASGVTITSLGHVSYWDAESGKTITLRPVEGDVVQQAAVDSSGRWAAMVVERRSSGRKPGTIVRTLDTHSGRVVRSHSFTGPVRAVAVDPDGKWLATASSDGVEVWSTEIRWFKPGGLIKQLPTGPEVQALAVCPGESWLLVSSERGISVWDTDSWQRLPVVYGSGLPPVQVMLPVAQNGWMASAHAGGTIRVWRMDNQAAGLTFAGGLTKSLAMAPDGRWLASAGLDGAIRLWRTQTGAHEATLYSSPTGSAVSLPDGRYRVKGSPERLWWAVGLCRFDADDLAELEQYLPDMRQVPEDEPLDLLG